MHEIINLAAVQIFIGTLPITVLLSLTLIDVKSLRSKIDAMDVRLSDKISSVERRIGELAERVSRIEGKIEGHHVVLEN